MILDGVGRGSFNTVVVGDDLDGEYFVNFLALTSVMILKQIF